MHQTAGTFQRFGILRRFNDQCLSGGVKPSFGGTSKSSKSSNSRKAPITSISFFLVANRAKPLIDVPPWRRPSEPHGALNEVTCLGERTKWSWFRRILDHEGRIDTKVEHA